MQLNTNLKHISTEKELLEIVASEENVMVCCGRMGPMCIPVYASMEELEKTDEYKDVKFYDMPFDSPEAMYIRKLPECAHFRGLPFTVYWKNGKVVKATSSIQTKDQITDIIDNSLLK